MNSEAFKLARETLRQAIREYGYFRGKGYVRNRTYQARPGKFEGEHWRIVHYYQAMLDGGADEFIGFETVDTVAADVFHITDIERQAFGFSPAETVAILWHSEQGFETLEPCDETGLAKYREEYSTDEP